MRIMLANAVPGFFVGVNQAPPLGLGYLAGSLRRAGHEVGIVDNYLAQLHNRSWSVEDFAARVAELRPDLVGDTLESC